MTEKTIKRRKVPKVKEAPKWDMTIMQHVAKKLSSLEYFEGEMYSEAPVMLDFKDELFKQFKGMKIGNLGDLVRKLNLFSIGGSKIQCYIEPTDNEVAVRIYNDNGMRLIYGLGRQPANKHYNISKEFIGEVTDDLKWSNIMAKHEENLLKHTNKASFVLTTEMFTKLLGLGSKFKAQTSSFILLVEDGKLYFSLQDGVKSFFKMPLSEDFNIPNQTYSLLSLPHPQDNWKLTIYEGIQSVLFESLDNPYNIQIKTVGALSEADAYSDKLIK